MRSRLLTLIAFACAMALSLAGAVQAQEGQCGGTDMLAEMAKSDPAAYEKIASEAKALENTQALLWRVEKQGIAPSHLFGTMHLSDRRITTLSPAVSDALKNAKTVVLEVGDLSPSAVAAAMTSTTGADFIYTNGKTLEEELSPEEFATVVKAVSASGLPGEAAKMLKPWLVSTIMSVSDCERRLTASGAKVLDMQLADRAKAAKIPVAGLETVEQQLTALASVPEDQQLQMLRVSLKHYARTADLMETVLQLYLKRNMGAALPFQSALAAQMGVPDTAFDGFKKSLLVDRNARMKEGAATYLDKGNAFIAVGALHLPGKTGLVTLLREAGYTLTPIE